NPSDTPDGGDISKTVVIPSPSPASSKGISWGEYFQPSGRFSFTFPFTGIALCERARTLSSFGDSSPKIHTPLETVRLKAGTTSTGRYCSPFTGSVQR